MENKVFTPKTHGYIDYSVDAVFFLAPSIFNFSSTATALAYVVGGAHLVMNLVTRYPLSMVKWMPFPLHGTMELIASIALVVAPNLFGFAMDESATWFYRISGVAIFGVWATTDYQSIALGSSSEKPVLRAA